MNMNRYLSEIEFAVTVSLDAVWKECNRLQELQARVTALTRTVAHDYARAEAIAMNAEDPDDVMLATGVYWDTYFGSDKDRYHSSGEANEIGKLVSLHAFSCSAQSGSVLQYAKLGISLVHAGPSACPEGRSIGSQRLKNVIWQGRNPAMHWEEGRVNIAVQSCFQILAAEFRPRFADFLSRSLAFEVVDLLGWRDYVAFERDMLLLS
jgi:hypothetical protein